MNTHIVAVTLGVLASFGIWSDKWQVRVAVTAGITAIILAYMLITDANT